MQHPSFQRIKETLDASSGVHIVIGKNPSLDTAAAALSLYLALIANGKQSSIACPTDPIVEISSLVGIDKIKKSIDGEGGDLVVSFPYQEGEIEKVSYTLEDGVLNIIVKAGELGLQFSEKDVQFKRGGGFPTLLVVVGTPRIADLGILFDPEKLKDTTVINIDNKGDNQGFGDIVCVSSKYSSVSELIAEFLFSNGFNVDLDIAQNLLSGIEDGTSNFQNPTTSITAFEMVATLMRKGAVRAKKPGRLAMDDLSFIDQPLPKFQGDNQDRKQKQFPRQVPQPFQRPAPRPQQQFGQQQQSQQPKQQNVGQQKQEDEDAPPDWLAPKVYKGSTLL